VSPALTRKEKQAKTRSALLKSAAKLICRKGITDASVDDMASDAGYTKGAFYANFKSKEELFLTMLDEHFAAEIERMDRALAGSGDPGEEARHAAADFTQYVFADSEWPTLYFQFAAQAARDEEFREELATRSRAMRAKMAEILRRWSADFTAEPPLPLDDLAAMIDFMASGFILERTVDPDIPEEMFATMMGVFVLGVRAMAEGWEPPPRTASP
jgi:AcrR family transcriptional regulator